MNTQPKTEPKRSQLLLEAIARAKENLHELKRTPEQKARCYERTPSILPCCRKLYDRRDDEAMMLFGVLSKAFGGVWYCYARTDDGVC